MDPKDYEKIPKDFGVSTMSKQVDTQAQTSFIGAQQSYLTNGTTPGNMMFINQSI